MVFEKQDRDKEIKDTIVGKREVSKNPLNYDSWFDYVKLEESLGNKNWIREVYERESANNTGRDVSIHVSSLLRYEI